MSKKHRPKTCVYCCVAMSESDDHVFSRQLFLIPRRDNLPKVPACKPCNVEKSKFEHYVTTVLPFGGRHQDAAENLSNMVPRRLEKNAALQASLHRGMRRGWTKERGLFRRTASIPVEWAKIERWLEFAVRGLAWHHWNVLIGSDCAVSMLALSPLNEGYFQRLRAMRAANRICEDVGAGTISYEASQGVDNPKVSVWEFSIYGGLVLAGASSASGQSVSKIGALLGPKTVFERAEKKSNWLRGQS